MSSDAIFFFNDPATPEIYTLSLHDALPILTRAYVRFGRSAGAAAKNELVHHEFPVRSEEHTSELQSPDHLVCRLLLEKKKTPTSDAVPRTRCKTASPARCSPGCRRLQALLL